MVKTTIVVVMLGALALGCDKKDGGAGAGAGAKATGAAGAARAAAEGGKAAAKGGKTAPAIDALLAGVPGDAFALAYLDFPQAPWDLMTSGAGVELAADEKSALDSELKEYLTKHVGIDPSKAQFAVGFAAGMPPAGAVLVESVAAAAEAPILAGKAAEDYQGAKLHKIDEQVALATRGTTMIVGMEPAVRAALDTLAGKRSSVVKDRADLVAALRAQGEGAFVAFAVNAMPPFLVPPAPYAGLSRGLVAVGGQGFRVAVEGDEPSITALEGTLATLMSAATTEAEKGRQDALAAKVGEGSPAEGASKIMAAHVLRAMTKRLKPVRKGNRLDVEMKLDVLGSAGPMGSIAMVGIVAAVAIPSFLKYQERAAEIAVPVPPPVE